MECRREERAREVRVLADKASKRAKRHVIDRVDGVLPINHDPLMESSGEERSVFGKAVVN